MKSFLTVLLALSGIAASAQQDPGFLKINSPTSFVTCEKDTLERNIHIERVDETQKTTVGRYQAKGCEYILTEKLAIGTYSVTISGLSFEQQTTALIISETNPTATVELPLKQKSNELGEVTVYGNRRQYIKVESDKTTVSIKDNSMLNTGNALEAVKRLPGVVASPTGGLTMNGKGVSIYIDGAPSALSGTDLQNYLASLPASAIEKVELIYNPGASYDANSSGSIINIITSSKRMKGVNANFNINYNFNKYQKPSPQIMLNGKEKNLSWQTMLGYNYIDSETLNKTSQEFTYFDPSQMLTQQSFSVNTQRNLYFRTGLNYKLNTKSNLLFNYNLNAGNDRNSNEATTLSSTINFQNNGISKVKHTTHEFSLQYKSKLDTIGSTLDITAYTNFFKKNPLNESTSLEDNTYTYNNGNIDFDLNNYYLKYDFSFPFKKLNLFLNTGGKYNTTKVGDLGRYNFENTSDAIFDSNIYASTIDFDYSEKNLAFYVEARKKIARFNFTAGLRFEDYKVERAASTVADKIKFNNTNLFPSLNAMIEINKNMNLSSSYSKKIAQPGYYNIDPNNNSNFNKYNTSEGNIRLEPVFFDNYDIKFSAFQYVQIGANYTVSKNKNQFVFTANDGELVSNESFASFDKTKTFSMFASFPIPLDYFFKGKEEFNKRLNSIDKMNYIFVNIQYLRNDIEGFDFGYPLKGNFNYGAQSQIILPWGITNTMSYFLLPKGSWEIYHIERDIQQLDISFNKDFLNKNLKIGLHCFDVFNTNEVTALIATKNLNSIFNQKQDSRTFRISLTYNFGNLKLEKEDTNINIEKANQGGGGLK